ncbi:hypothetical protein [Haladaptatus sp. DFWS20]|uniref:hypothetical protein n=1 Tax=Haladaptatus sp. DFWS20 TaxID=3403467 RepID=UPI003EB86F73
MTTTAPAHAPPQPVRSLARLRLDFSDDRILEASSARATSLDWSPAWVRQRNSREGVSEANTERNPALAGRSGDTGGAVAVSLLPEIPDGLLAIFPSVIHPNFAPPATMNGTTQPRHRRQNIRLKPTDDQPTNQTLE